MYSSYSFTTSAGEWSASLPGRALPLGIIHWIHAQKWCLHTFILQLRRMRLFGWKPVTADVSSCVGGTIPTAEVAGCCCKKCQACIRQQLRHGKEKAKPSRMTPQSACVEFDLDSVVTHWLCEVRVYRHRSPFSRWHLLYFSTGV